MAKGEDGRKWKCKFYTPEARRPEALRRPHLALVGGGSKHSAEAKMQFWLTSAISCNCNTPPRTLVIAEKHLRGPEGRRRSWDAIAMLR